MNAIVEPYARGLVRRWKALRRWSTDPAAEDYLVKTLQDTAVSCEHAQAIVDTFDDEVPTPHEIRDVAANLRSRFELQVDQAKEWREKYGPADPFKADISVSQRQEDIETTAIIKAFGKPWAQKCSAAQRYAALHVLGFKLNGAINSCYGNMIEMEIPRLPARL